MLINSIHVLELINDIDEELDFIDTYGDSMIVNPCEWTNLVSLKEECYSLLSVGLEYDRLVELENIF